MHPYRTPAPRELEPAPAPPGDPGAAASFAASIAVVAIMVLAVGFLWGADVAGLFATIVAPPFVGLACDDLGP